MSNLRVFVGREPDASDRLPEPVRRDDNRNLGRCALEIVQRLGWTPQYDEGEENCFCVSGLSAEQAEDVMERLRDGLGQGVPLEFAG